METGTDSRQEPMAGSCEYRKEPYATISFSKNESAPQSTRDKSELELVVDSVSGC
jgi:hypothetical protein